MSVSDFTSFPICSARSRLVAVVRGESAGYSAVLVRPKVQRLHATDCRAIVQYCTDDEIILFYTGCCTEEAATLKRAVPTFQLEGRMRNNLNVSVSSRSLSELPPY
jgi:hypothetical protein